MIGTTSGIMVQGHVEDGWGKVSEVFRANFEGNPGEVGAACCVYVGGRAVVDLWGGLADREANRPWDNTIVAVASTTKGAAAICAHLPVQRGELDLDAPVIKYWPEFGASGKEQILVCWLLLHQAGLPIVDGPSQLDRSALHRNGRHLRDVPAPIFTKSGACCAQTGRFSGTYAGSNGTPGRAL